MMKLKRFAVRVAAFLAVCGAITCTAQAASITSIAGTGTGFSLTSSSFDNTAKTATLNLTANSLFSPFNVRFLLSNVGAPLTTDTYTVTVNMTNGLGRYIPGFDVVNGNASTGWSAGLFAPPFPNPGNLPFENASPIGNIDGGWRFGGLTSGGGSGFSPGQTKTVTFAYAITKLSSVAGNVNLTFTANPEPTTLLLGSLAMIPAAVVARRRRKAASELIEA